MGLNLAESGSLLEGGSAPTRREENLGTMYSKMPKPPQSSKTRNWTSWIRRHDEDGKKCWLPLRFLAVRLPEQVAVPDLREQRFSLALFEHMNLTTVDSLQKCVFSFHSNCQE